LENGQGHHSNETFEANCRQYFSSTFPETWRANKDATATTMAAAAGMK
jgi:hypothetical protein